MVFPGSSFTEIFQIWAVRSKGGSGMFFFQEVPSLRNFKKGLGRAGEIWDGDREERGES